MFQVGRSEAERRPTGIWCRRSNWGWAMAHEICVSNPRRIGEGVGAYISYVVQTSGEFDGAQGVRDVNRRYSDFDWLRNELLKEWPGCVVPPLPSKLAPFKQEVMSMVEGTEYPQEIFEHRRLRLELFLRGVEMHDALRCSKTFRIFLEANDQLFQSTMNQASMGGDSMAQFESWSSVVNGLSQWFGEAKEKVVETSKELAKRGGFAVVQRTKTSDDLDFEKLKAQVQGLTEQLSELLVHAKAEVAFATQQTEVAMLKLMLPHLADASDGDGADAASAVHASGSSAAPPMAPGVLGTSTSTPAMGSAATAAALTGAGAAVEQVRLQSETQGRAWVEYAQSWEWLVEDQLQWLGACAQSLSAREDRRFEVQAREAALQKALGRSDAQEQQAQESALRLAEQQFAVVHQSCLQDVARIVVGVSAQLRASLVQRIELQRQHAADRSRVLDDVVSQLHEVAARDAAAPATTAGEQSAEL
eukprot:g584.t1